MEEAAENGKESSYSARANERTNEWMNAIARSRPDITFTDKVTDTTFVLDITVPHTRIDRKV